MQDAVTQQVTARAQAMDAGRPFSWTIDRPALGIRRTDVQAGVYLKSTQGTFQQYEMPRRLAKWEGA